MKNRYHPGSLAVAAAILLLSACQSGPGATLAGRTPRTPQQINTPPPTVINRGLAYGEPCAPPCWEGLRPGISTRNDVQQTLEQLQDRGVIPAYSCSRGGCTVTGVPGTFEGYVVVSVIEDGLVSSISGDVGFDFTAQELFDLIGEPTFAYAVTGAGCTSCEPVGGVFDIPIHLLYPQLGAWFLLLIGDARAGCVCPDARVIAFEYFPPMTVEEAIDYLANVRYQERVTQESDLIRWHGFGSGYAGN